MPCNAYVGTVGMQTSQAQNGATAQQSVLKSAQSAQQSVSGVNLDQEAANMLQYEQAYQAAAQIISTSNTLFNSLLSAHPRLGKPPCASPRRCSMRPALNGSCRIRARCRRRRISCRPARASTRRPTIRSGEVQLLQLDNANTQYQQYVSNGQSANTNLTLEENALSSATRRCSRSAIWWCRPTAAPTTAADLQAIATQISARAAAAGHRQQPERAGQYLFAGYS